MPLVSLPQRRPQPPSVHHQLAQPARMGQASGQRGMAVLRAKKKGEEALG